MNENGLVLSYEPGGSGPGTITATLGGEVVHVDLLDLRDAQNRATFAQQLQEKLPAIEAGAIDADAITVDTIEAELLRLIPSKRPEATKRERRATVEPWRPFPVDELPEPLRRFVRDGSKAIGCDPSYLALPLLAATAAAIGDSRGLELKRGWTAPAILWTVIVGESGTAKTPAFQAAMRPIRERQRAAFDRHGEEMKAYEAERLRYDRDLATWKRSKTGGDPPEEPRPPTAERCTVSDTTIEALAPILLDNPRGLLLYRDELAGWLGSFDRYAGGKKAGGDAAAWLSMYNGEALTVDRKTGTPKTIFVPHAMVSITGGIQPAIMRRALTPEHRESGLAARLLLACPPRLPKQWTEAELSPDRVRELVELFDGMFALQPETDEEGRRRPALVRFSPEAKATWLDYYDRHNAEQVALSGDLAAAWSKLEEIPARLALVLHCVASAGDHDDARTVSGETMARAIALTEWFKAEARRVYSLLAECETDRERRELVEWIEQRGGRITARDLQHKRRGYATADDAEADLNDLVSAGLGEWAPVDPRPGGGRPTRVFQLRGRDPVDNTPEPQAVNEVLSTVDTLGDLNSQSAEWGEV